MHGGIVAHRKAAVEQMRGPERIELRPNAFCSLDMGTPAGQFALQYRQICTVRISKSGTEASPEQFLNQWPVCLVGA